MKKTFRIFYWGILISFLGSLPPGIINIVGTKIYNSNGIGEAFLYVAGFMLAEALIVRITLSGMTWLVRSKTFFNIVEWTAAATLVLFSIICFFASVSMQQTRLTIPELFLPPFELGAVFGIINPMHIPFWLGWSTVLMNKEILTPRPQQYNIYIIGIAIGTMTGIITFVLAGSNIFTLFQSNEYVLNIVIGLVLFFTAAIQIRKLIRVPVSVRHAKIFKNA
jgi:threonine/homoserine/homoserine lactone efflux protein